MGLNIEPPAIIVSRKFPSVLAWLASQLAISDIDKALVVVKFKKALSFQDLRKKMGKRCVEQATGRHNEIEKIISSETFLSCQVVIARHNMMFIDFSGAKFDSMVDTNAMNKAKEEIPGSLEK
ncbi:hypothetical protein Salat_1446000 [Sesamum alatum]|uniref:Uncharacterized protein n=1 Tax=Sesamum alatum TaxID=300844 RepID=A0AAE1YAS6_9LAMI|nr:hypothetical protein Salat_1446000 [Sesamum alatum]